MGDIHQNGPESAPLGASESEDQTHERGPETARERPNMGALGRPGIGVIHRTPARAYRSMLMAVRDAPEYTTAPRGKPAREITDYQCTIGEPSAAPIVTADQDRNKVIEDYTRKEMELYTSMTNRAEDFAKASKFWESIANPDGTINSAYGYLIWRKQSIIPYLYCGMPDTAITTTPWQWAVHTLLLDKYSRQAYVRFSLPEHQWFDNKDQVCTMHMNFQIRSNENGYELLNGSVVMRSSDVVLGTVYDLPFFCYCMERMWNDLRGEYPSLAIGCLTFFTHSLHMYEKDLDIVNRMIEDKRK